MQQCTATSIVNQTFADANVFRFLQAFLALGILGDLGMVLSWLSSNWDPTNFLNISIGPIGLYSQHITVWVTNCGKTFNWLTENKSILYASLDRYTYLCNAGIGVWYIFPHI